MPDQSLRRRAAPLLALAALLSAAYIGRAVISSDGAEVLSETLGFLVQGRFEAATLPPQETTDAGERAPWTEPFHSRYGLFPGLLPLPFAAAAWPLRDLIGARGLDASIALTWATGVALCALGFVRLARAFRPEASGWWGPALVAGTFLWPYAADSFVEPFAAACIAFGAARLLPRETPHPLRAGALAGGILSLAFLLKPILWIMTPAFLLVALLPVLAGKATRRFAAGFVAAQAGALAIQAVTNGLRYGSIWDFGYGGYDLRLSFAFSRGVPRTDAPSGAGPLLLRADRPASHSSRPDASRGESGSSSSAPRRSCSSSSRGGGPGTAPRPGGRGFSCRSCRSSRPPRFFRASVASRPPSSLGPS